jgi:hypothetical protein
MVTDPEPNPVITLAESQGSIAETYPNREHGPSGMDSLKVKALMVRISPEGPKRLSRLDLNGSR